MGEVVKNITHYAQSALNRVVGDVADTEWLEQVLMEWYTEVLPASTSFPSVKVAHIKMSGSKQIPWPKDFGKLSKLGIDRGGKIWTLGVDNRMVLPSEFDPACDFPAQSSTDMANGVIFAPHWYGGVYYDALFGMGGGFNDRYYKIDYDKKIIKLSDGLSGYVILEYHSNGKNVTPATLVDILWGEAARMYGIMELHKRMPKKYNSIPLQLAILDYDQALLEAQQKGSPTFDELLDMWDSGSGFHMSGSLP